MEGGDVGVLVFHLPLLRFRPMIFSLTVGHAFPLLTCFTHVHHSLPFIYNLPLCRFAKHLAVALVYGADWIAGAYRRL